MTASLQCQCFILGESAGAYWASVTLILHPDLNIRSGELYYPMAGDYQRQPDHYRGYKLSH